jgi:hypothetical protein
MKHEKWTDITSPLCIHFMHFVQRMLKMAEENKKKKKTGNHRKKKINSR